MADPPSASPVDVNFDPMSAFQPATEEHIGYLHSLGLDYGYGPTSMVQWLLEHIHVYSGLPWWGSLITTSIFIRLCFIPLTMKMSDGQARMATIKPILDPLNKRLAETMRTRDALAMAQVRQEMNIIRRRSGFSMKWMGITMVGNMVFAICSFKLLRAMAALPVPGFLDGGAFWFQDLTLVDPYYIIPGIMALGFHLSVRFGAETGGIDPYANQPGLRTLMMYVLPCIIGVSMAWFSAALTIWMAAGGLVSIFVGRALQSSNMRERLGLFPLPKQNTPITNPLANLFSEENDVSPRVIDATGTRSTTTTSQPMSRGVNYQAPRVKKSKFSTSSPSSFSNMTDITPPTAADIAREASAPSSLSTGSKKSLLERYTNWATARVNDLGDTYALVGRKISGAFSKAKSMGAPREDKVPESKTKSKEYMRDAAEYERRYEQEKKRGWR